MFWRYEKSQKIAKNAIHVQQSRDNKKFAQNRFICNFIGRDLKRSEKHFKVSLRRLTAENGIIYYKTI